MARPKRIHPTLQLIAQIPDRWALEAQGRLLALAKVQGYSPQQGGGRRGNVTFFSRGSRMRLLKKIARVDWRQMRRSIFLHLTYPDDVWERSLGFVPKHIDLLYKRMEYHLKRKFSLLWKVEWKTRLTGRRTGELAPHVHMLPCGVTYYNAVRLQRQWKEVIGSAENPNVEIRRREGPRSAANYAAKYASKGDQNGLGLSTKVEIEPGRAWAWRRQELVPWARQRYTVGLTEDMVEHARLIYGLERGEIPPGGFTLFVDDAESLFKKIIRTGYKRVDGSARTG